MVISIKVQFFWIDSQVKHEHFQVCSILAGKIWLAAAPPVGGVCEPPLLPPATLP